MRRPLARALALACLAFAPLAARAAEGRTPVFAPGTVITTGGRYIVTRNLTASAAGPIIDISSPDVDLDLNGMLLDATGSPFPAVRVSAPEDVHIHGGTVRGGTASIEVSAPSVRIVVEDILAENPNGPGIHITDAESFAVRRAVINNATAQGILIDGGFIKEGSVQDCTIRRGTTGIAVANGIGVALVRNRVVEASSAGSGHGIVLQSCSGCLVAENNVQNVDGEGIRALAVVGSKFFENVVQNAGGTGLHLDAGSTSDLVLDNSLNGNGFFGPGGGHGLLIEGKTIFAQGNSLNGNSGFGLRLAGGSQNNTFGRNMARGNVGAAPGPCAAAPPLFPPNSCNDGATNTTYGDNLIPGPPVF